MGLKKCLAVYEDLKKRLNYLKKHLNEVEDFLKNECRWFYKESNDLIVKSINRDKIHVQIDYKNCYIIIYDNQAKIIEVKKNYKSLFNEFKKYEDKYQRTLYQIL